MKNFYSAFTFFFLIGVLCVFSACSDDDDDKNEGKVVEFTDLPNVSQQFVKDHFSNCEVTKTLQITDGYAVSLNQLAVNKAVDSAKDGYEIEFDRQGNWIEIEGRNDAPLPANILALIPRPIVSYVNENHTPRVITEITKESYGYKIDLTGNPDIDLKFDYNGNLLETESGNGEVIEYELLPSAAKDFLSANFKDAIPSKIEKEKSGYEVEYADKTEVDFDLLGLWRSVDVEQAQMPQSIVALLPKVISEYITATYPTSKIETIKNKISTYEIELKGDIDLVFDKEGNLWGSNTNKPSTPSNGDRLTLAQLPVPVQSVLNEYLLTGTKFLYAELEDNEYEVKLANGTDMEFDLSGNLKSIEVLPGNHVPDGIVNAKILSYVKANYSNRKIEEYEVKTKGYKVELSGYPQTELIFDINGNFKGLD